MFIGNVTAGQIGNLVWTNATRTLTADPATDAGAATLVWTHASRTLTADPATDAGAATLVWTHSTRTLTNVPDGTLNDEGGFFGATTSAVQGSIGAWVQVVASTAHAVRGVGIALQAGGVQNLRVEIGTGTAGSEVSKIRYRPVGNTAVGQGGAIFIPVDTGLIPKGVRVALAIANDSAAAAVGQNLSVTLYEDNS